MLIKKYCSIVFNSEDNFKDHSSILTQFLINGVSCVVIVCTFMYRYKRYMYRNLIILTTANNDKYRLAGLILY